MENKKLPPMPTPIKCVTIYEGVELLEINHNKEFEPKRLIEKFDYWSYKRSLKKESK